MKTIVVDDEPFMLKSFARNSKDIPSFEIIGSFYDPEEALKYAENNPVELAVLDIEMPGMTGTELAKALKKLNEDIRIVIITAYEDYFEKTADIKADGYLLKPYSKNQLRELAEKIESSRSE